MIIRTRRGIEMEDVILRGFLRSDNIHLLANGKKERKEERKKEKRK